MRVRMVSEPEPYGGESFCLRTRRPALEAAAPLLWQEEDHLVDARARDRGRDARRGHSRRKLRGHLLGSGSVPPYAGLRGRRRRFWSERRLRCRQFWAERRLEREQFRVERRLEREQFRVERRLEREQFRVERRLGVEHGR